ncbi:sensor histidine kinase [Jeotgalibacillus proteolyticus]|uniref:Signal transduction histidine-protein kinase/phosphatase DegS n=1 Tax=Jeotgalibacillus proteolyticus TaxID=2082395 RepID=A0A2S5GBJ6_9BACL|nr:sensor histidine kinase [Jeotgalibacillus proteolyticus]PPA70263.1 histidine kinase [Jeotgalibacillus proteolyticus]
MSATTLDSQMLDIILGKMIDTVDQSKSEIFEIGEQTRNDYEKLVRELGEVREKLTSVIYEGDELERRSILARKRLAEVSHHFKNFSEEQVRQAYESAHDLQIQLSINRQEEKQLRNRRDELERRLQSMLDTIERAENLVNQISVVLAYLNSDIKKMGAALQNAEQKQEFSIQIIEAQEEERKRLSREIHDGPAQMIANVLMRSDLIERVYKDKGVEQAFLEIKSLKKMIRSALSEVRRIIYDLRPMALDDLGLIPTLRKYLSSIEEYSNGTKLSFIQIGEESRLHPKYEVSLFRLVQESVQNALKHAKASEITVKAEMHPSRITIVVKDNGKGFDTAEKKKGSFGLIGMRERVELLNGELSILSKPGSGTMIMIKVPL